MNISDRVLRTTVRRSKNLPKDALTPHALDFLPKIKRKQPGIDFATRVDFLSRGGAFPTGIEYERLIGTNDLVDEFYLERALLAAKPVCRISIRNRADHESGCATGFMVSPRILMTNYHVFSTADEAAPSIAEFNYTLDIAGRPETSYRYRLLPNLFYYKNENLDFCLVAVNPLSVDEGLPLGTFGYHRLLEESGKTLLKEWMTIIQHPGGGDDNSQSGRTSVFPRMTRM